MSNKLLIDRDGSIATVTLNRPDAFNSWDDDMKVAMRNAVGHLNDDDDVRVVILKGAGKGFSAGADIRGKIADPVSFHLDYDYKPFLTGIAQSDKIWIGQIHGAAAGVSAAIAMNCDLVVMAEDAYLYMAFAAIGLVPDGGNTQLLLKYFTYQQALQIVLEGKKITAKECLEHGIANKVVSAGELDTSVRQWAEQLCSTAPLAMAASKRLLRSVGDMSFGDAITAEGIEQTPLLKSDDFKEGVNAFFEKRKPVWTGK